MNFQQLRIISETMRQHYNLTKVANALFTSQSGVSKHIKDLEDELGIELFIRKGKRFTGLTAPGKQLITVVERVLQDTNNIKRMAEEFSHHDQGELTIVTTHTQAQYALPSVVSQFKKEFSKIHLVLHQSSPSEIVSMLLDDQADIGIATEALGDMDNLISFPYYSWHHSIIVPPGHPLLSRQPLTLEEIARFPIITYHQGFTGRSKIDQAFASADLTPDIAMSALDADVIKTYVKLGLGIGIIASVAFNPGQNASLIMLSGQHLFEKNTIFMAIRRNHFLRSYAYRFMELCVPTLSESVIHSATQI